MPDLSTTVSWDTIRSLTHPKVSRKIADNITARIPLLYFLNRMGNKEYEMGGGNYQINVFKELKTAQAYTGTQTLTSSTASPVTPAFFERKQLTIDIQAVGTDLLKNSGSNPEAIINYLTVLIQTAEEGMKNSMAGSSIGIFSSQAESDAGITGLQNIVSSTPSSGTTGALDRATYTFWRNQQVACATGFNTNGLISMRDAFYAAIRGDEAPTIIVTTRSAYMNFERSLTATINYNIPSPKTAFGDLYFEHIYWHGVPVMFDDNCPANTMYMLNTMGSDMLSIDLECFKTLAVGFPEFEDVLGKAFGSCPSSTNIVDMGLELKTENDLFSFDNSIGKN